MPALRGNRQRDGAMIFTFTATIEVSSAEEAGAVAADLTKLLAEDERVTASSVAVSGHGQRRTSVSESDFRRLLQARAVEQFAEGE